MPDIEVQAQGKTFTFPDGTDTKRIGEAVDAYFKGAAKPAVSRTDKTTRYPSGLPQVSPERLAQNRALIRQSMQQLATETGPGSASAAGGGEGLGMARALPSDLRVPMALPKYKAAPYQPVRQVVENIPGSYDPTVASELGPGIASYAQPKQIYKQVGKTRLTAPQPYFPQSTSLTDIGMKTGPGAGLTDVMYDPKTNPAIAAALRVGQVVGGFASPENAASMVPIGAVAKLGKFGKTAMKVLGVGVGAPLAYGGAKGLKEGTQPAGVSFADILMGGGMAATPFLLRHAPEVPDVQPALSPEVANQVPLTAEQIARQRFDRMVEAANAEAGIEQPAAASRVLPRRGKPTAAQEVPGAVQEQGPAAQVPRTRGARRNKPQGGQGVRPGDEGQVPKPAGARQAKAAKPAEEAQPSAVQQEPEAIVAPPQGNQPQKTTVTVSSRAAATMAETRLRGQGLDVSTTKEGKTYTVTGTRARAVPPTEAVKPAAPAPEPTPPTEVSGAGQPQTGAAVTPSAPETRVPARPAPHEAAAAEVMKTDGYGDSLRTDVALANRHRNALKASGHDTSEVDGALEEHAAVKRSDYPKGEDGQDDYESDKMDAWTAVQDAFDGLEPPETKAKSVSTTERLPAPKRGQPLDVNGRKLVYIGKNAEGQHIARDNAAGQSFPLTDEQVRAGMPSAKPASTTPTAPVKETPSAAPTVPATAVEPAAAVSEPAMPTGKARQVPAGKAVEQVAPVVQTAKATKAPSRSATQYQIKEVSPTQFRVFERTPGQPWRSSGEYAKTYSTQEEAQSWIDAPKTDMGQAATGKAPKPVAPGKPAPIDMSGIVDSMETVFTKPGSATHNAAVAAGEKIRAKIEAKEPITSADKGTLNPDQVKELTSKVRQAVKDKALSALDAEEQAARARIAKRGGVKGREAGATLHPDDWADIFRIGQIKFRKGMANFDHWSRSMIEDIGDFVRPHLERVWKQISDKPPYSTAPDSLMGYGEPSRQKGFSESNYKHTQYVRVQIPGDEPFTDAVKGMNASHAMERARRNWEGADIRPATAEEINAVGGRAPGEMPKSGQTTRRRMGKQTGAFDVSILADAAKAVDKIGNISETAKTLGNLARKISPDTVPPQHGYEVMSHGHLREMSNDIANKLFRGLSHTTEHIEGSVGQIPAIENAYKTTRARFKQYYLEPAFKGVSVGDRQRFESYGLMDRLIHDSRNVYPVVEAKLKTEIAAIDPKRAPRKLQAYQKQLKAIQDQTTEAVKNIANWKDPVTGNIVTEPELKAWMDAHRDTITKFKQAELLSNSYRVRAGRGSDIHPGGLYGGYYVPGVAEGRSLAGGGGAPLTKPMLGMRRLAGTKRFTGSADAYKLDPVEVFADKFSNNYASAFEREFYQSAVKHNIAVDAADAVKSGKVTDEVVGKDEDGNPITQQVMKIPGRKKPVPVDVVRLGDVFGRDSADMKGMGIPERVYMPTKIISEITPAFDKSKNWIYEGTRIPNFFTKVFISGAAEAIPHGVTIGSARSAVLPHTTGIGPLDAFLEATKGTGLKAAIHFGKAFTNRNFSVETRYASQELASRYGVARPYQKSPLYNPLKIGGNLLYSEKGAFNNTIAEIYEFGKKNKWSDDAIGKTMQELNTHAKVLRPWMQNASQQLGGGAFYQTGATSLRRAYKFGALPATLGVYVLSMAKLHQIMDEKHRYPWEVPGRSIGQVPWKNKDGKTVVLDVALDRNVRLARQFVNTFIRGRSLGESPATIGMDMLANAINQATGPTLSSPFLGVAAEAIGTRPYAVTARDRWSLEALHTQSSKLDPHSFMRLRAMLEQAIPGSTLVAGETPQAMTSTHTDEPAGKFGNYLLNLASIRASQHAPQNEKELTRQSEQAKKTTARNFLRKMEAAARK